MSNVFALRRIVIEFGPAELIDSVIGQAADVLHGTV